MFYNTYRATKSAMRQRQLSETKVNSFINPKERLINHQKREKLKNLLITKFIQKYNIKNPEEILEPVISKYIYSAKLNDKDLKRLDLKIQNLIKDKFAKDNLKSNLIQNLQENNMPQNLEHKEIKKQNKENILQVNAPISLSNTIDNNNQQNSKKKNEFPSLNQLNTYSNTITKNDNKNRNRGFSSYIPRNKKIKYFKSPAEELTELEKELEEEDLKTKKNYRKIDIQRGGDEWGTIVKYNKILYDRQIMEEKMKDKNNKIYTKNYLDNQIKEKVKKAYDDELKEKEYNKIMEEHSKKLDELERIKSKKIKEQIIRLKENRDAQIKNEQMRKKIEKLKEKKYDLTLVKNYKENLEKVRKEKSEKKRKENEALRKAIKENEIKQQFLKEKLKKEKEDDIKMNEERIKIDLKQEEERKRYYNKIKILGNKYSMKQAEEILMKVKKEQKEEDDRIQYYYDAKKKEADEKEVKERLRKQKEKEDIKKYLDMQIDERKKKKNF